ncbi:MAG: DUF2961 domain-containing protein [Abitibacteriaceae bacterium]|nr:DUF2961 domain-containing protein [Abditibacteriaceae bacterium]
MQSLLSEMVNRDAVAQWPVPSYICKQASSHDRLKTSPADPKTWHSNKDFEQFIRTEDNEGRHEWVIMEDNGPGAITRIWLPLNAEKDNQIVRFYFDGSPTPSMAVPFNALLSGRSIVPPPFAFVGWNDKNVRGQKTTPPHELHGVSGDLYLPIPFARSCKVTLDQLPFYYIIDYRMYQAGTAVKTFTMADYQALRPDIERIGDVLTADTNLTSRNTIKTLRLAPGAEVSQNLPGGAAAVRNLVVQIDPKDAPQVLRSTILEAAFDGEPTVWCPLGEFFGAGARLHPVQDWWRTVSEDGRLTSRWVMPYRRSARLALRNVGTKAVTVGLAATTGAWHWDERSLYFHANWHGEFNMKTRPMFDWNYLEAQGQGIYVGDTLTVFTPAPDWYGEGDERVYIDGETAPSHIGTGTEDYYGYAWGMANYFNSPFISMPERDSPGRDNWRGYTTTSRLRLLDGIPFRMSLKHDMEVWNWADTQVDYAVGTFWYARPGAQQNRSPQPREASVVVRDAPPDPRLVKIAGALEFEALPIIDRSPGLATQIQEGGLRTGQWSGNQQLFVTANKVGDYVEIPIPVANNQKRKITLYGTKSYDYGILRFSINGQTAGADYDAYSADPVATGPIELGTFEPHDGKLVLRVEVIGSNPASRGNRYYFGLDCVVLQ